jgi:membrane protease subunit (stomatin/prohibitin family)
LTQVKDDISGYLIKKKISVLEINAYISEISESLKKNILPTFSDYGIELINFFVNDISVPEDDNAVIKLKDALAKKAEMDIIGYSYTQERSFDTLEGAAKNQGSGSAPILGAGVGLGMGLGIGSSFGGAFGDMGKSINTSQTKECPNCHKQIGNEFKFCPSCGKDTNVSEKQNVCSKCGLGNRSGLKFCGECGHKLFKTCPKCGEATGDNQKFCPSCGESLIKKCSSCGSKLQEGLKFCPECGKKVEGENNG